MTPLVVVVTVNWNRRADTLECLDSLADLTYANRRVVVVDNGSSDGSPAAIAARHPDAIQIETGRNLGFSAGFNVGLRRALELGADYALALNNDTLAAPDLLEALLSAAEPAGAGLAGPVIYYAAQPERVWSSGAGRSHITLELTGNHGRAETLLAPTAREFISGCAMLIRRDVLERVGLFDERFFMYYEDSDYCLRVRQAGHAILAVPAARLWHKVSVSSQGGDSPGERYWMARSSVLFFRKHTRGWRWLAVIPWRAGSALKTVLRLALSGRGRSARAYLAGLLGLPPP